MRKSGIIVLLLVCAEVFFVTEAHGQENSTAILREIQTMLSNQTSTQNKMFDKMATSLSKSSSRGAYTALSVFWKQDHLVMVRFWPLLTFLKT